MGRSFGYAAYRALSRRKTLAEPDRRPDRPAGELVWMHAETPERVAALCDLATRLRALRPDTQLLLTIQPGAAPAVPADPCAAVDHVEPLDEDHPDAAARFLEHWAPDLCLWAGAGLRFNLIVTASERGVPLMLVDIDGTALRAQAPGWLRGPQRSALTCFEAIMAIDKTTGAQLRKLGVPAPRIEVTGPLRAGVTPPPCSDEAVAETTKTLAGRPVWLAAHLPAAEADAVLAAHRQAVRLSHRLLLVLHPANLDEISEIDAAVRASGLRAVGDSGAETLDENTQLLTVTDPQALGLWYRIAQLCFLGGSFSGATSMPNPMHPAALGAAVLYGPAGRTLHSEAQSRLTKAGAARRVSDAETLAQAVVDLIAPDRVAEMALAGWEVVTEGAEMADRVLERMQDMLDLARVAHARS